MSRENNFDTELIICVVEIQLIVTALKHQFNVEERKIGVQ